MRNQHKITEMRLILLTPISANSIIMILVIVVSFYINIVCASVINS